MVYTEEIVIKVLGLYHEGADYKTIAKETGLTKSQVNAVLYNARKAGLIREEKKEGLKSILNRLASGKRTLKVKGY